jgi:hypothetical protein
MVSLWVMVMIVGWLFGERILGCVSTRKVGRGQSTSGLS